jgi:Family of unknown function (DUF5670)
MNTNTLLIIAIIILVLWALGFFGGYLGALINILLVIAVILIVVWLVTGKKLWR